MGPLLVDKMRFPLGSGLPHSPEDHLGIEYFQYVICQPRLGRCLSVLDHLCPLCALNLVQSEGKNKKNLIFTSAGENKRETDNLKLCCIINIIYSCRPTLPQVIKIAGYEKYIL